MNVSSFRVCVCVLCECVCRLHIMQNAFSKVPEQRTSLVATQTFPVHMNC